MWPGQQPPGGEQNPQDQNPYQQPGYQQPNPYQQPGYHQPNPYQQPQPGAPGQPAYGPPHQQPPQAWSAPSVPPGAPEPPRDNRKRTATIAIISAVAVVAAAAITGVLVLNKDDSKNDESQKGAGKTPTASSSSSTPTEAPTEDGSNNPRRGDEADVKPVIPGWKTVVSAKRHNAFDVPASWVVESPGLSTGFEDDKGKPLVIMSAPASYRKDSCTIRKEGGYEEKSDVAGAGSKGAQGATSEASAAKTEAENWVFAAFDQKQTGVRKVTEARKFTSDHGLRGYTASATVTGVKKIDKCTTDGKSFTVTYTDTNGDFATWVLWSAKGVKDEVPDATIKKIMSTLRPLKSST